MLSAQVNQVLGNDIMNPRAQQTWMTKPAGDPSGLAYLKPLDFLLAKQVASLTEMLIGLPSQVKFGIFNEKGEQVYYAFEESDAGLCERLYCPKRRRFELHVVDNSNQEIIRIKRDFRYCGGCVNACACCSACQVEAVVESPPGTVVGYVSQAWSCWRPHYELKDANDNVVLSIVAPCCIWDGNGPYGGCFVDSTFTIFGTDGTTEVGTICKQFRGFLAETRTSADQFSIRFPMDLDAKMKAVALGAVFLIDFSHFYGANVIPQNPIQQLNIAQ